MEIILREERVEERFAVECLTREAFWNVYRPGCDEHLALHQLRESPGFIPELDLVAEADGQLIGHICYVKGYVAAEDGCRFEAVSFGPVSVLPKWQRQGIGSQIISRSLAVAAKMGYAAVFITGSPSYYERFGFETASSNGTRLSGVPEGDTAPYFMGLALREGSLKELAGTFQFDPAYETAPDELALFEENFPPKEKLVLPGQIFT